jgi:hypothetical protein
VWSTITRINSSGPGEDRPDYYLGAMSDDKPKVCSHLSCGASCSFMSLTDDFFETAGECICGTCNVENSQDVLKCIGTGGIQFFAGKPRVFPYPSEVFEETSFKDLPNQFALPPKGRKPEEHNLNYHLRDKKIVKPFVDMDAVRRLTDREYKQVEAPNMEYTYEDLYKFCETRINRTASPGYPFAQYYKTNGEFWDKASHLMVESVHQRLQLLMLTNFAVLPPCPFRLFKMGLRDICRVFVKTEPVTAEKLKQGRSRIVSSVSVIDSLCEKFLFRHICESNIDNWRNSAAKPGMGFTQEHNDSLIKYVLEHFDEIFSTDMKFYDWSILRQEHDAFQQHCIYRTINPSHKWLNAIRNTFYCIINQLYAFSDGTIFVLNQYKRANQISGQFNTTTENTFNRLYLTELVGTTPSMAAGDDCNETTKMTKEELQRCYHELGKTLKDLVQLPKDEFEFCSHIYNTKTGLVVPVNINKAMFNALLNNNSVEETIMQAKLDFGTHPLFGEMEEIIRWLKDPAVRTSLREYMGQSEEININQEIQN